MILGTFIFENDTWVAIGSLATAFMAFLTYLNLRDIIESKRARLVFTIVIARNVSDKGNTSTYWCLKMKNIGLKNAYKINLHFANDFIDSLPIEYTRKAFRNFRNQNLYLEAGGERLYVLSPCKSFANAVERAWLEEYYDKPIIISAYYNERCSGETTSISIENFDTKGAIFNEGTQSLNVNVLNQLDSIKVKIDNGKNENAES